eukprot:8152-Pelagococcus_subviridis.AAC.1
METSLDDVKTPVTVALASVASPLKVSVPVTPTPDADSVMMFVAPNPMPEFDAPPVIRTLSTSTNPLSLEIVSPL